MKSGMDFVILEGEVGQDITCNTHKMVREIEESASKRTFESLREVASREQQIGLENTREGPLNAFKVVCDATSNVLRTVPLKNDKVSLKICRDFKSLQSKTPRPHLIIPSTASMYAHSSAGCNI